MMRINQLYNYLKKNSSLIRELIISELNGVSLSKKDLEKYKDIDKIPFIIKSISRYCDDCGEYNEDKKPVFCHSCQKKLSGWSEIKYRTKIYGDMPKYLTNYNKERINLVFDNEDFNNIKNKNLMDEYSKITVHISPFFRFNTEFIIHPLNLNHIFMNWNNIFAFFNKKTSKKLFKEIKDYVFEEKNNTILWKKINSKTFPKMIKDLLLITGHKNVRLGGQGTDQGKDILSKVGSDKWLTQCKFYRSNSVSANEIATIDWLATHQCNCYRLAALKVSGSLVTKLKNLDGNRKFGIKAADFWDEDDLRKLLVENDSIRRKYFGK